MIVLDTNVLSALMKAHDVEARRWVDRQRRDDIWITSISILKARSGILQLPTGRRREGMMSALDEVLQNIIAGKIQPFDASAAEQAARIATRRIATGLNIATLDTQIAGICVSRGASLATRNLRHFVDLGIPLIDPWTA